MLPPFGSDDHLSGMQKQLPSTEFSQFIETGSTLSYVSQRGREVDGLRFGRQLPKGRVSRTVDAPGIGIVLMHNPVERIKKPFLQIHRFPSSCRIFARASAGDPIAQASFVGQNRTLFQPLGPEAPSCRDRWTEVELGLGVPPSHMELLPVQEAKKEQAEYEAQMKKEAKWAELEEKDEILSISG